MEAMPITHTQTMSQTDVTIAQIVFAEEAARNVTDGLNAAGFYREGYFDRQHSVSVDYITRWYTHLTPNAFRLMVANDIISGGLQIVRMILHENRESALLTSLMKNSHNALSTLQDTVDAIVSTQNVTDNRHD
jgi:hypothetical protein